MIEQGRILSFSSLLTSSVTLSHLYLIDELHVDMKDEPEEREEWAKPLAQLWQSRPYNPQAERSYNQRMGLQAPYCSICLLFHTYDQVEWRGPWSLPYTVAVVNGPSIQLLMSFIFEKIIIVKV
jgi:hypothetical protein